MHLAVRNRRLHTALHHVCLVLPDLKSAVGDVAESQSMIRAIGVGKQGFQPQKCFGGPGSKYIINIRGSRSEANGYYISSVKACVTCVGEAKPKQQTCSWIFGSKAQASFARLESPSRIKAADMLFRVLAAKPKHPLHASGHIKAAHVLFGAWAAKRKHPSHF